MKKVLFYSFRTNKNLKDFKKNRISVFVFSSLKRDFEKLEKIIEKNNPEIIFGFATIQGQSRIESKTVNRFGSRGKVSKNGKDSYSLEKIGINDFKVSKVATRSFCNWTMYRTKEFINESNLSTQVGFVHFNLKDTEKLIKLCQSLTNLI